MTADEKISKMKDLCALFAENAENAENDERSNAFNAVLSLLSDDNALAKVYEYHLGDKRNLAKDEAVVYLLNNVPKGWSVGFAIAIINSIIAEVELCDDLNRRALESALRNGEWEERV